MKLTDLSIKAFPVPAKGQRIFWDALKGFGVRISQGGTRTFVLMHGRSRQLTTIGRVGIISLADARAEAKRILAEKTLGRHRGPSHVSFEDATKKFLETHDARKSTMGEYERILNRHFMPKLRHELLERIGTEDLLRIIDKMAPTPSEARHAYASVSVFFNWAVSRRMIEHSPLSGTKAPKQSASRDRVLSDDELAIVLKKARAETGQIGKIVQLLILLGQRRGEVGGMRRIYIESEKLTITWPGEVVKNGRQHTIPICRMASEVIESVTSEGDLLFPARGSEDKPFCGWSKPGLKFIQSCGIAPWTLHDLRRTFASGMQRLGVRMEITEKLLNHTSGSFAGIVAVYQRHNYLPEMREALEIWERHLHGLLTKADIARECVEA